MRLSWKCGIIGELRSWVFVVCFVFWYFHFLLRYWCVYQNSTLFSQTRLIHVDSSNFQKIFFWKLQQKLIFLPKRTFKIRLVMFVFWSFEMRCEFFILKISPILTNFIILWIKKLKFYYSWNFQHKKFSPDFKWSKYKHNQTDFKSSFW